MKGIAESRGAGFAAALTLYRSGVVASISKEVNVYL